MAKIADVFVNLPVKSIAKAYTYSIPDEFAFLGVGWRVLVPFGGRKVEGFTVAIGEREDGGDLKAIDALVDQEPWFNASMLALAYWMGEYYLCSVAEAMRLFMPGKSGSRIKAIYRVNETAVHGAVQLEEMAGALFRYIKAQGAAELPDLYKVFSKAAVETGLRVLLRRGWIVKTDWAQSAAQAKWERYFCAAQPVTAEVLANFSKKPAQKKLLTALGQGEAQSAAALKEAGFSARTVQELVKSGYVKIDARQILRDSYRQMAVPENADFVLTAEQAAALAPIEQAIDQAAAQSFLLHGITGSGKTLVYIEAVKAVRRQNRQAIVLVPEIALTGQMIRRFKEHFPAEVVVMHSRLSISERNDAILRVRRGEASIVIGARSAIFTPLEDIGIIIMDEEHDSSYKQDESPRYHTRDIARKLAALQRAVLLLGSATPSVESFAAAECGTYQLLTLAHRVGDVALPLVKVVDMRNELRLGRRRIISALLQSLITATLQKGEQVIILLNRRGFSTFVMCRECGYVVACANCTLPLVYHKDNTLQCHFCAISATVPDVCPKCASRYIKYFGSGTEKLEAELGELFPAARVVRMDRDTTGKKFAHERILQDFAQNRYDILLGTQMVAKGHDIQNVTAVGIISADSSLNLPDFRAAERCFGLITQAAGRAGRGSIRGKVVVQTYNPEHYAVSCGARHDYIAFYRQEIVQRQQLLYPPYSELIKLTVQDASASKACAAAGELAQLFRTQGADSAQQVLGPVPAAVPKLREQYRYTILLKAADLAPIKAFMKESGLSRRMDIIVDVNPLNVL